MLTTQVLAQEKKPAGKPGAVVVNAASITATVEAIDYDKRTVALKGPRGNVVELKVDPNVKNTAFDARKPDERPIAEEASAVEVAAPGEKAGGAAVDMWK